MSHEGAAVRHLLIVVLPTTRILSAVTCNKYSIPCQDDLLTADNAQSHVTAFRPISEAARSWSDDNRKMSINQSINEILNQSISCYLFEQCLEPKCTFN